MRKFVCAQNLNVFQHARYSQPDDRQNTNSRKIENCHITRAVLRSTRLFRCHFSDTTFPPRRLSVNNIKKSFFKKKTYNAMKREKKKKQKKGRKKNVKI